MKGLNEDVIAGVTSAYARNVLTGMLTQAQGALDKRAPRTARNRLVDFIEYVVAYSHLSSSDSRYIKPEIANDLTCATANVMTNIAVR
jgi:hypothetical protein